MTALFNIRRFGSKDLDHTDLSHPQSILQELHRKAKQRQCLDSSVTHQHDEPTTDHSRIPIQGSNTADGKTLTKKKQKHDISPKCKRRKKVITPGVILKKLHAKAKQREVDYLNERTCHEIDVKTEDLESQSVVKFDQLNESGVLPTGDSEEVDERRTKNKTKLSLRSVDAATLSRKSTDAKKTKTGGKKKMTSESKRKYDDKDESLRKRKKPKRPKEKSEDEGRLDTVQKMTLDSQNCHEDNLELADAGSPKETRIEDNTRQHLKSSSHNDEPTCQDVDSGIVKLRSRRLTDQEETVSDSDMDESCMVAMVTGDVEEDADIKMEDGGKEFAVMGGGRFKKKQRVTRVLPDWLARPTLIEHDLDKHSIPVEDMKQLDQRLVKSLHDEGINRMFPVQRHVIPVILASTLSGLHAGDAGYQPRDLCVSAPTGSGKTLAFAIPIVQSLLNRVVPLVRALVVLPTRDLAQQVTRVFNMLCRNTPVRTILIGGLKKFGQEQQMLVETSDSSRRTHFDIVVATPGRLVDHINKTRGFSLQSLRFLVIDEADRMMDQISQDWIAQVEKCVFSGSRPAPGHITVNSCSTIAMPLQKLLFSATLSQNPEKLMLLNLFQPRLITSVVTSHRRCPRKQQALQLVEERGEFVGKFTTPVGLKEYYIQCSLGDKPLLILHLIKTLSLSQILCFANSVKSTHRLYHLLRLVGGIEVAEFSSNQSAGQRRQILKQFKAGKIKLLVCSDAMARGMDVVNAKYVVSYDMAPYLKMYIHRVGRTARGGKTGVALSLLQQHEVPKFLKMLKHAGKMNINKFDANIEDADYLVESYEIALEKLRQHEMLEAKY